jgi:hypothetical protein
MQPFEIRICAKQGSVVTHSAILINDFAAIRRAQTLASNADERIEVWRGADCIFKHERMG